MIAFIGVFTPSDSLKSMAFVENDFKEFNLNNTYLDSLKTSGSIRSVLEEYNLALAYYSGDEIEKAVQIAQRIITKEAGIAKTQSYLLLSQSALHQKDTAQAIIWLSEGIVKTGRNSELLYNFELLKRKFKNTKQQAPKNHQNNSSSSGLENNLAEKSDKKDDDLESSNLPKISRKQALQILETLKEKEILFIPKTSQNPKESKSYGKL